MANPGELKAKAGEWRPVDDYTSEALEACEKALRTIVSRIGAWGERLVLFGGLAPRYIVRELPADVSEHTGTTDLDVVVGLAIGGEDAAVYSKLQKELRNAGFEPNPEESYAWERRVDSVKVVLEFFCPVEEGGEAGRLKRNPGGSAGSTVSAIQLRGAELAGADCTTRTLSGDVLDHGGRRDVEVRVVNILPFLVLKAFALETRDKEKDAYDIVWTLDAFGDLGPEDAAEVAADSPIADSEYVAAAMELLAGRFRDLTDQGPSNYARFFIGAANNDDERTRLRRFARDIVQRFLARWHELRSTNR